MITMAASRITEIASVEVELGVVYSFDSAALRLRCTAVRRVLWTASSAGPDQFKHYPSGSVVRWAMRESASTIAFDRKAPNID
jgi:hypothetical protein